MLRGQDKALCSARPPEKAPSTPGISACAQPSPSRTMRAVSSASGTDLGFVERIGCIAIIPDVSYLLAFESKQYEMPRRRYCFFRRAHSPAKGSSPAVWRPPSLRMGQPRLGRA